MRYAAFHFSLETSSTGSTKIPGAALCSPETTILSEGVTPEVTIAYLPTSLPTSTGLYFTLLSSPIVITYLETRSVPMAVSGTRMAFLTVYPGTDIVPYIPGESCLLELSKSARIVRLADSEEISLS